MIQTRQVNKHLTSPACLSFIFGLFKQTLQLLQQYNVKSIQYLVMGFKHTTTLTQASSHNHRPGLPTNI